MKKTRTAFTMVELVFVIVIIGILAAVAIPRLSATRDDAEITKARVLVASVANAVRMERQKRILRGNFDPIFRLTDSSTLDSRIFNLFDGVANADILDNPPYSCKTSTDTNCWRETNTGTLANAKDNDFSNDSRYTYNLPIGGSVDFNLTKSRFICSNPSDSNCKLLTQ